MKGTMARRASSKLEVRRLIVCVCVCVCVCLVVDRLGLLSITVADYD